VLVDCASPALRGGAGPGQSHAGHLTGDRLRIEAREAPFG
jgi:hypothetical protein